MPAVSIAAITGSPCVAFTHVRFRARGLASALRIRRKSGMSRHGKTRFRTFSSARRIRGFAIFSAISLQKGGFI